LLSELNSGPNASLNIGFSHFMANEVSGPPARAVSRNDDVRIDRCDILDCLWDYLLEDSTGQVHSADEGVDLVDARYALRVPEHIDCA